MIFAVGSGRCGTKTMAQVLDIPHKAVLLPWTFSQTKYKKTPKTALAQCGAVGCYWISRS